MYIDIQVPTFRRNLLLPSAVQKKWPRNVLFYENANCNLHITAVRTSNITKTKADLRVDSLFCVVYCMTLSTDVLQHWMVWKCFQRSSHDLLTILYQKDWAEQWTISVCIASEIDDIGTRHHLNKSLQFYQNTGPKKWNFILRPLKRLTQKFIITSVCRLEVTWASVSNGMAYTTYPVWNIRTLEKRVAAPRYWVTVWTSWLSWTLYRVTLWCSKSRKHTTHSCDSNWKQCAPSLHVKLLRCTLSNAQVIRTQNVANDGLW